MREITKIEVQQKDKTRVNIYLDDKFYAGISAELCFSHNLKKGMEIDEEFLSNLIVEDEKTKAISRAVKYMGGNLKTTKQIRDYLRKKEYLPQTIDYVLEKMAEYKYLDDESYARAYISTYSSKYGKMKLISQLKERGIKEDIIDKVFAEDVKIEDSLERVAQKYLKNKEINNDVLIKLCRFLYSRGYESDAISSYVRSLRE